MLNNDKYILVFIKKMMNVSYKNNNIVEMNNEFTEKNREENVNNVTEKQQKKNENPKKKLRKIEVPIYNANGGPFLF